MLNLAMNAGILSSIFNGIKGIVDFVTNITDILKGLFQALVIYLFAPVYYLFMGICSIVNFAEMLFKKFAGIDPIMTNDGEMNILDVFIKSNEIWGLFVSILVLSIVLLFLFTIVAVIKSEFAIDAKGSAKGPIIARSLKSLAMFIIVPTVSLLGVYAVNAITDTINSMMKGSDDTSMVNQVFYSMSYNANKARINQEFADYIRNCDTNYRNNNGGKFKGSQEDIAYAIDQAFKTNMKHSKSKYDAMDFPMEMIEAQDFSSLFMPVSMSNYWDTYSIWDIVQVNFYFSILDMDYVIGLGSAIVITYLLLSMCVVLLKRIFEIVILMLLAAPMISLAPLDGGSASKSWQKEFIKRVLAIVAPVFSINLYFIMIPLFMKISIFNGGLGTIGSMGAISMSAMGIPAAAAVAGAYAAYDALFQIMAICVGMSVVKTSQALLCNLLGIEDLVKSGQEATKKAVGTAVQVAAMASGVGGAGMAAVKGLGAAAKGAAAAGKGNRLAGLKSGWASTQKERGHAMELLKDKTMGSDIVKNSAFGQLFDKSTYTNMGKTNKEIDAEKRKKEKEKDLRATEAANESIDTADGVKDATTGKRSGGQKDMKKEYQQQITSHYDGEIAKQQAILSDKSRSEDDRRSAQQMIGDLMMKRENALAASEKMKFERNEAGAVVEKKDKPADPGYQRPEVKDAFQTSKTTAAVGRTVAKGAKAAGKGIATAAEAVGKGAAKVGKAIADSPVGDAARAVGHGVSTAAGAVGKGVGAAAGAVGKAAGAVGHAIADSKVGDAARAVGHGVSTAANAVVKAGKVVIESKPVQAVGNAVGSAAKDVAGQAANAGRRVGQMAGAGTDDALREAEKAASNAANQKALLEGTSQVEANMDGLSDQVEKGMNESAHNLARAIKEALQQGKLNVDGIAQLRTAMDGLNKAILNHQKNDQSTQALQEALDKLTKAFEEAKKK